MSAGSSANNSWTIVTPEETVAETLRPLADGTENHGGSLTSAPVCGGNRPADCAQSAEGLPVEGHLVSKEEKPAALSGDTNAEQHGPPAVTDASAPTADSSVAGGDELSQSEGPPGAAASPGPDTDSFSDSYAHVAPSPDEPSASLPSTETLGGVEFTQDDERLAEEGTRRQLDREELQQEGEESDLSPKAADLWKQAEEADGRFEKTGEEAEPELRRRSLLVALERIGRSEEEEEEEEEVEEEFRPPQREDSDSGFSVNKCILAVVILLGLGTIFFSGVFMNLDEESEYGTTEQNDAEEPRKRWLNPEVPPLAVDADGSELVNNLAKRSQQISLLQAQLQEQKEELKVAKLQAEEGVKERLQWEEVEKENSRLKKEMATLPVLQKENERMKRELESAPALQKELESLRSTVTELKLASAASEAAVKSVTSPSSGQPGNGTSAGSKERQPKKQWDDEKEKRKAVKKDHVVQKKEVKEEEVFEWKEGKRRERKDDDKTEWHQGNAQGKPNKEKDKGGKQKHHGDETKQWKDKERKKEKGGREDEGKSWKYKEGKKEWIEKSERKEKESKDWKRTNHEHKKEGKQWRGKEEKKDWKVGKDHAGKHKEEWKKGKDVFEASLKKDWKEKGEKKEWKKKDGNWKSKNGKDGGKEGTGRDDRKPWDESKNHGKERKRWNENEQKNKNRKDERKLGEETAESWKGAAAGREADRNRDGSHSHGHKEQHRWGGGGGGELPHTHSRPSPGQPEYWIQQRLRLQRRPKPPRECGSSETCARAEGLLPVPFPEFRALLQTYLAKAEEAGADGSGRNEIDKLASEYFRDGVFAHDQTSFREFVEDLGDILEDLVEGDDDTGGGGGGEERDAEEEMEEFGREAMERFSAPRAAEEVGGSKGEWRKQSAPGRG